MKAIEAIKSGSKFLKENKVTSHILDAEILLSKSLNQSREEIMINLEQNLNNKEMSVFHEYLNRRSKKEPIAYILGEKEFWSKKFYVNRSTLIPDPKQNC